MSRGIVISLCDLTGVMVKPWVANGYQAILVDPQHPEGITGNGPMISRIGHVIDHEVTWLWLRSALSSGDVVAVFGFPPCTDLAVSGARWFETKRHADPSFQFKAMQVVHQCQLIGELSGAPWFLENPVSQISSLWRKPDHSFHPWHFTQHCAEDNYTKKTMLWSGGGFVMPGLAVDESLNSPDDRIHKAPPGPDRANFRSATPAGFARAVYLANAPHLKVQP